MPIPANAPAPYGALPSSRQLRWHELETYAFLHFTTNTFTDKEWGYGDEAPEVFNPTAFDAEKIVADVKAGGFKGLILTCKHHDGFCLWPSAYTEHSVKHSPWKNGQGDVVREISDACRAAGVLFGVYLSPWDRNHAEYATPVYIEYFRNQLRELLTNYGPLFMVWFDGANGGDGYYGGAREKRGIDNSTYYDWDNTIPIVRELQPDATIFSDGGPDIRWVGNERGIAPEKSWHTLNGDGVYPGLAGAHEFLPEAHRNGTHWLPAEADVSIRPGWFYHAHEDDKVKTPAQLLDIYYASVGHGAGLNLNLPPDRRGLIHETDAASVREFRRLLDETFATNLASGAAVTADSTREGDFTAGNVLNGERDSFWAAPDGVTQAEFVFELPANAWFDVIQLGEYIPLGQRIESFDISVWRAGDWTTIASGTSVGHKKLVRLPAPIGYEKLRLRLNAPVAPALANFGLYLQPAIQGSLETESGDPALARWTILSQEPHVTHSGTRSWVPYGSITPGPVPQEVVVNLQAEYHVTGFGYLPRQDGSRDGIVSHYEFWLSPDGEIWEPAAAGEFANIANNPMAQTVELAEPRATSFVKIVAKQVIAGDSLGAGEIGGL